MDSAAEYRRRYTELSDQLTAEMQQNAQLRSKLKRAEKPCADAEADIEMWKEACESREMMIATLKDKWRELQSKIDKLEIELEEQKRRRADGGGGPDNNMYESELEDKTREIARLHRMLDEESARAESSEKRRYEAEAQANVLPASLPQIPTMGDPAEQWRLFLYACAVNSREFAAFNRSWLRKQPQEIQQCVLGAKEFLDDIRRLAGDLEN